MTTPFERTRALVLTRQFLQKLAEPFVGVVPLEVMAEADRLLRDFPTLLEIDTAHKACPELFGPAPPFQRVVMNPELRGVIDATKTGGRE